MRKETGLKFLIQLLCWGFAFTIYADSPTNPPPLEVPTLPDSILNAPPPKLPDNLPSPDELIENLRQLDKLLSLSDEELDKLLKAVRQVREMPSNKRELMQLRISKITRMTATLKREIAILAYQLKVTDKRDFTEFWLSIEEQDRETWRNRLNSSDRTSAEKEVKRAFETFLKRKAKLQE